MTSLEEMDQRFKERLQLYSGLPNTKVIRDSMVGEIIEEFDRILNIKEEDGRSFGR